MKDSSLDQDAMMDLMEIFDEDYDPANQTAIRYQPYNKSISNIAVRNISFDNIAAVEDMKLDFEEFDSRDLLNVVAHSIMTVVGVLFNLVSLVTAFRVMRRPDTRSKTNVHYIVFQLIIADCLASFIIFPMEAAWRYTIQWYAGNVLCKLLMILRTGGFYLSSNMLVVLSIDRYISISRPFSALDLNKQRKRSKVMVIIAWLLATICSLPQGIIFRKEKHPTRDFHQCVSIGYFESISVEETIGNVTRRTLYGIDPAIWTRMYDFSFNVFVFFIPLFGIVISYTLVHLQMIKRNENIQCYLESSNDTRLNRIARKSQMTALKMSIIHTLAFFFCWLPYVIFSTWYVIDHASVTVVIPEIVQDMMGLSGQLNTCINPIVYAAFYFSHVKVLGKRQQRQRQQYISMTSFQTRISRRNSPMTTDRTALD